MRKRGKYMRHGSSGSKFAGQSIKTRILLLVGGTLLLFSLITGYSIYSLSALGQTGVDSGGRGIAAAPALKNLEELLGEAGRNAEQFLQQQNVESVLHFRSAMERLTELARQLEETAAAGNDDAGVREARRTGSLIGQYGAGFDELAASLEARGLNRDEGLLGDLKSAAERLESALSAREPHKPREAMEQILAAQGRYLNSPTPGARQSLETAVRALDPVIGETPVPEEQKEALQKRLNTYARVLERHYAVSLPSGDNSLAPVLANEQQRLAVLLGKASGLLEKALNELSLPQSPASHLETLRRHEEAYLSRGEKDDADHVLAALDRLARDIDNPSAAGEDNPAMREAVPQYREAFTAVVRADEEISDRAEGVALAFAELKQHLGQAGSKGAAEAAGLFRLPVLPLRHTVAVVAAAMVAAGLICLLAASRLADSIISPILRLRDSVRRIHEEDELPDALAVAGKGELDLLAREIRTLAQTRTAPGPRPEEAGKEASGPHQETGNEEDVLQADVGQPPVPERISAAAGRLDSLCAVSARDIRDLIDRSAALGRSLKAATDTAADSEGPDTTTAPFTERINDIIRLTADLAEETRILALNAAIKAEHAGTCGSEFTMVVEELDKQAKRAKQAAGEISSSLHGLAQLHEAEGGPWKNYRSASQSIAGEIDHMTAALQEVETKIRTITGQVEALREEPDDPARTSAMSDISGGEDERQANGTRV
ncbi:MAG: methyl-accepting chemotaxis protein [Desulfobulbaceae bacterium]|nr:methyl-accepting chemotaxis protein [Desulfobulbaceae bacterium]